MSCTGEERHGFREGSSVHESVVTFDSEEEEGFECPEDCLERGT